MRIFKQSQCQKIERRDLLGFLRLQFAAKYQKTRRRDPLATNKTSKKCRTVPKKIQRGTLQSRLVLYLTLEMKYTKGTFCTDLHAFPLAGPVVQ